MEEEEGEEEGVEGKEGLSEEENEDKHEHIKKAEPKHFYANRVKRAQKLKEKTDGKRLVRESSHILIFFHDFLNVFTQGRERFERKKKKKVILRYLQNKYCCILLLNILLMLPF